MYFDAEVINVIAGFLNYVLLGEKQDGGVGRHPVPPPTVKKGQQQFENKKPTRNERKSNCMEVRQPRR